LLCNQGSCFWQPWKVLILTLIPSFFFAAPKVFLRGGLGEYFGIDPTPFRLLFIAAALFGGPGIIAYLIFLIIVPQEPLEGSQAPVEVIETESQEDFSS